MFLYIELNNHAFSNAAKNINNQVTRFVRIVRNYYVRTNVDNYSQIAEYLGDRFDILFLIKRLYSKT